MPEFPIRDGCICVHDRQSLDYVAWIGNDLPLRLPALKLFSASFFGVLLAPMPPLPLPAVGLHILQ